MKISFVPVNCSLHRYSSRREEAKLFLVESFGSPVAFREL